MENPDERMWVRFYSDAVENPRKSKEAGRPIYDAVEMVEVRFPGDRNRIHHAPAHGKVKLDGTWISYADRFPRHYEAFKRHEEMCVTGTPLKEMPTLSVAKRAELERLNILSVEQLAALEGSTLQRLGMGGRELKTQAEAYLQRASEVAGEMERRKLLDRIAELERLAGARAARLNPQADTPAPPPAPAPDAPPVKANEEALREMSVSDLRTVYKQVTGRGPAGQPSHETLVSMVLEALQGQSEAA